MVEHQRQHVTGLRRYWLLANDVASRAFFQNNGAAFPELQAALTSPQVIKVDKLLAGLHIIERFMPGFEKVLSRHLLRFDRLPLAGARRTLRLIGAGHGQNVFLFETACGRMVLKIDRESQALKMPALLREARRIKTEYEKICHWYSHIPGFILHEDFCIVNGPLKGSPALATIQPYIEETPRGFFEDFTRDELLDLIRNHDELRHTFQAFARTLIRIYRETGESIDLLGKRNLCLLGEGATCLCFTDAHDIYGQGRISRYPNRQGELEKRIDHIREILGAVQS